MFFEIGYINFVVIMFIASGGITLYFDVKRYKSDQMKKEMKVSQWFGWGNIALGLSILIANWAYYVWFV
jgi:hypothetical protein